MKSSENSASSPRSPRDAGGAASGLAVRTTTKDRVPALPFSALKHEVLGDAYSLSLVFAGDARTRGLNLRYRGKSYIPNVLAFPYDRSTGEIFINVKQAAREATNFGLTPKKFIALLFVHGMFHLKGMRHGSRMESEERRVLGMIDPKF